MANGDQIKVLIVDDDAAICASMSRTIQAMGLYVEVAEDGNTALKMTSEGRFDIIFLDVMLPDLKGPQILGRIHENRPETVVMMMTAYPAVEDAVESMKLGVVDYLMKPFRGKDVENHVSKCLDILDEQEVSAGKENPRVSKNKTPLEKIVGKSKVVRNIKAAIKRAAAANSTILITGESGTGKDLVARAIHDLSERAANDFVPVDCSALVETLLESELFGHVRGAFTGAEREKGGLFELADKGTFFFDEISNLSMKTQSKLLRVIQEREFMKVGSQKRRKLDIRILSSSNIDLERAIERGAFRNDLYYRINVVPIHLPPLRERSEDIPMLLEYYLKKCNLMFRRDVKGFNDEAMDVLTAYPYPGNIRELKHLVEQIVVLNSSGSNEISIGDIPPSVSHRKGMFNLFSGKDLPLEEVEKKYIMFILSRTRGIRGQAAEILGINRKTLSCKIKKYGLELDFE